MNSKYLAIGMALALVAVPGTALAGHASDEGQSHDNFPGLPGAAAFGLCNAADNADENATVAPPFSWLFANEDCEDVQHPSEDRPDEAEQAEHADEDEQDERPEQAEKGHENRPDHAGPPR